MTKHEGVLRRLVSGSLIATTCLVAGCHQTALIPNPDPTLRKSRSSFRADAAGRTYPADARKAKGLVARAQIGYHLKWVEVANLSEEDWTNVEVWIDGQYVAFVPSIPARTLKRIEFQSIYDKDGKMLPTESQTYAVSKLEVLIDGTLYDVTVRPAD